MVLQHYDGPVAATYWWVNTGSADEGPDEAGFAHFLEHMLFKDAAAKETGQTSTGKMAQAIESMGGDINAYTSFDQTVYHVTCAAHHWQQIVDDFGTIAKPQRFLKADFDREREVILEELRKNEDAPSRQLFQQLFSATYKKHPYGRPVIGYVKTLKAATLAKLEGYYRRNYVAEKMGLVLVGPLYDSKGSASSQKRAILQRLEKRFGASVLPGKAFSEREAPKTALFNKFRPEEPALRKTPTFVSKAFDVKTPTLALSFRIPELLHDDTPTLDLLSGILSMGEMSRLYQRLFYQTSLATEVSGGMYIPRDPGMIFIQLELDSMDKINRAAEEVFKELAKFRNEDPSQEELSRVIVNVESERLYATQTADGMAGRLGFLKFLLGDLSFDQKYLEELKATDIATIRDKARQYLDYRRLSGVVLYPKSEGKFDTSEISAMAGRILQDQAAGAVQSAQGVFQSSASAGKARKHGDSGQKEPEIINLPSGLKVAFFERPQSHVFSIHAAAMGGSRLELACPINKKETDWGTSYMMSLTWTKGTPTKTARDIANLVEGHAASFDGFSGRNSVGLQMTGLARDWGVLAPLFSEVLLDSSYPEDEVEHSRRVAEESVRGIEDHSSQLCSKLFLETLYEQHPYGSLTYGSLESIKAINSGSLNAFHRAWIKPERLVIGISGAVKRSTLESWLIQLDEKARAIPNRTAANEASFPLSLPDEPALKGPRWVEKNLGREQLHMIIAGLGTKLSSEDRFAIRLLQTLLGGQSGRLFVELREKKSLAYTVSPVHFEGIERGYIGTYIASAPQKKDEAISGIKQVLEQLAKSGPKPAEMNRAKEFFLGRRAMDLQGDSALAAFYGMELLYGVPHLSEEELVRKIRAISAKELREACRNYLVEPFMVTSVVG